MFVLDFGSLEPKGYEAGETMRGDLLLLACVMGPLAKGWMLGYAKIARDVGVFG